MCGQGFLLLIWFSSCVFWEMTQVLVKFNMGKCTSLWGCDSQHFSGDAQRCAWPDIGKAFLRNLFLNWKDPAWETCSMYHTKMRSVKHSLPRVPRNSVCVILRVKYSAPPSFEVLEKRTAYTERWNVWQGLFRPFLFHLEGLGREGGPDLIQKSRQTYRSAYGDFFSKMTTKG